MSPSLDVLGRIVDKDTLNLELNTERYLSCEMREIPAAVMVNFPQSQISFTNVDIKDKIVILQPFVIPKRNLSYSNSSLETGFQNFNCLGNSLPNTRRTLIIRRL